MSLSRVLWDTRRAFLEAGEPDLPWEYHLNLLQQQVEEARQHVARGLESKALNEMADAIAVAFRALCSRGVKEPEHLIRTRLHTRVIPHARAILERDLRGNGFKTPRKGGPKPGGAPSPTISQRRRPSAG